SAASGPTEPPPATPAPVAASDAVSTVIRLEREEMWLREVLDRAPMPMVLIEPASGHVVFANRAAHEMAWGEHPTVPPETNTPLLHDGKLLERDELPLVRAARGERLVRYEITALTATGERTLALSSERLPALHGHPETIVVGYEDLTALRQGEELFRSFFSLGLVGLGVTDSFTGRFLMVNSKMEDITGYSAAELQERSFLDITHPEDRDRDQKGWRDVLEGRQRAYQAQKRYVRKDGSVVWVLLNAAAMRERAGRAARTVAVVEEISALKDAERCLAEAVRLRDEFLTVASHELRTPLAALLLRIGSLRRQLERSEPRDHTERLLRKLAAVERASDRLAALVEHVLDASHLTTQPLELERTECDLADLVQEVLEQYQDTAQHQGCSLEARLEPAWGSWDRARMRQVLGHLLGNACRFGRRHPIELTLRPVAGSFVLAITDHGGGIRPEDLGRIFEPFERAASVMHHGGLYLVKRIVEAHGGRVEVESQLGKGSCFTMRFPSPYTARTGPQPSEESSPSVTAE
ncbi:MAG TPA: PAS domain-containing sensor histidine kinase, partial [Polyangia bacterium]|nr:PAS domain-containing sensor histidine kinase [Polyangia bacterium]